MLKMAGAPAHPAVRIVIGLIVIGLGVARHSGPPALIIGGVLVLWGTAAVLRLDAGGRDAGGRGAGGPRGGRRR